ncbi:MAG: ATPase, T2SS/T4P/T4SS family [Candidatus Micrarchaeota archaeon]|nr:ATPase, T2SS/T4P/T4SS family [Candidatus Micrarchaeota archaeon]
MALSRIEPGYPLSSYYVEPDELPEREESFVQKFIGLVYGKIQGKQFCEETGLGEAGAVFDAFVSKMDHTRIGKPLKPDDEEAERRKIDAVLRHSIGNTAGSIAKKIVSRLHGYKVIGPLFEDNDIEEILINGAGQPVLVHHRKNGICKTNISFENERELRGFVNQFLDPSDKPFEDIKLPDGSRANVLFPPAAEGTTVTIRKFRKQPYSIVELVAMKTLSPECAAFLWTAVDGLSLFPLNIVFVGGTASGKTTTLNAAASFIPPSERVITIEDTRELNFRGREDWLALETNPKASLNDLLKNAIRMRPDRIIVGEVRGREAETMFTAMNVGHRGTMGSFHANSDREAVTRLENAPMNVPRAMIPLVDLIVVQHRVHIRGKGLVRRVTQVSEVSRTEDVVALNEIYRWDPVDDKLERTDLGSQAREKLARATGVDARQVSEEIDKRREIIEYLIEKKLTKQEQVNAFMSEWYAESAKKKTGAEKTG